MTPSAIGRVLIGLGVLLVIMGGAVVLLGMLPRLPGDIYVQRRGFTLYVPILGSILVSLLLTLLLNLFFARR
ncbi:MAG TPA: DUF2905 family protein [bacterium]|nr:DUF2905 family protein [bacterium]